MTPTDSILPEDAPKVTPEQQRRRDYLTGLRELANFLESHPDLPIPGEMAHQVYVFSRERLAAVAREPGVRWEKSSDAGSDYFKLRVPFCGDQSYEVFTTRDEVCRKVVTGTRLIPATPEHEVETYEWVCDEPLLAGAK